MDPGKYSSIMAVLVTQAKNRGAAGMWRAPFAVINGYGLSGVLSAELFRAGDPWDWVRHLDELMAQGRILKNDKGSFISRVQCMGMDLFVKRYNYRSIVHSVRHTIKGSRARRVFGFGLLLKEMGIGTPEPLGYIEVYNRGILLQSYIITEFIRAPRLRVVLQNESVPEAARRDILTEIRYILDRLGHRRITHGDLKHSNLLIDATGPLLVDLDAMKVHLCDLAYSISRRYDARRFMRAAQDDGVSEETKLFIARLFSTPFMGGRAQECADELLDRQAMGWSLLARNGLEMDDAWASLGNAGPPESRGLTFTRVPSSDYARVYSSDALVEGVAVRIYWKQYLWRSAMDRIKHLFRASRGERAFKAGLMLERNGLDTPRVLALAERRLGPFLLSSVLFTEEAAGCASLPDMLNGLSSLLPREALQLKRQLIGELGKTIGRMHALAIFHGDLRSRNILVRHEDSRWRFFLIDNERTRQFRKLPLRFRVKNLVQINMLRTGITNADRLRFWRCYLGENPTGWLQAPNWLALTIAKTEARLRKKHQILVA